MRFSLAAIFCVFTIACFGALVYQQKIKVEQLMEKKEDLEAKIAAFDPLLERELPFLRVAAQPDPEFEKLYDQVVNAHDLLNEKFADGALETPNKVSVSHLPCPDPANKKFSIYIPESKKVWLQIFVSSEMFTAGIETSRSESPFQLKQDIHVRVPAGKSELSLAPIAGNSELWEFTLNGEILCQANSKDTGLSGHNMIWLMSTQESLGSFRHHNIRKRVRYLWDDDKSILEFASFVSRDFMEAVIAGKEQDLSKLNCALLIKEKAVGSK